MRRASTALLERLFASEIHPISNQKLSAYRKEGGQCANLDLLVERVRHRSGRCEAEAFARWELLTCHTARRTCVTLALE